MENDERERLMILLDHWIKHNQKHNTQYLSWVKKMEEKGFNEVAERLKQASNLIIQANDEFYEAMQALKKIEKGKD